MIDWFTNHIGDFLYDFFKMCGAYFFSRWLYEGYYKAWRYGGWQVTLINTTTGQDESRAIAPAWAEKILNDKHDFSLYLKSFVSPFFRLNMDISDQKAEDQGLVKIDRANKKIIIDQAKNQPKPPTA